METFMVGPSYTGIRAVYACKLVLEDCGFPDIHIEMKEGILSKSNLDDEIGLCGDNKHLLAATTGLLGLQIGARGRVQQGTLCLHLRLRHGDGKTTPLALSCRHVFFDDDGNQEHVHEKDDPIIAVSSSNSQLQKSIDGLSEQAKFYENKAKDKEKTYTERYVEAEGAIVIPSSKQKEIDDAQAGRQSCLEELSKLKELQGEDTKLCELGHILYSPKIAKVPCNTSSESWYPDWALVHIGDHRPKEQAESNPCFVEYRYLLEHVLQQANELLNGTIPETHIWDLRDESPNKRYIDLKAGFIPETELFGLPNLERANRRDESDEQMVVRWCWNISWGRENHVHLLSNSEHDVTGGGRTLLDTIAQLSPEIRVILDMGAQIIELTNGDVARTWLSLPAVPGKIQAAVLLR